MTACENEIRESKIRETVAVIKVIAILAKYKAAAGKQSTHTIPMRKRGNNFALPRPRDDGVRVADLSIDLATGGIALEWLANNGQAALRHAEFLKDQHGGNETAVGTVVIAKVVVR